MSDEFERIDLLGRTNVSNTFEVASQVQDQSEQKNRDNIADMLFRSDYRGAMTVVGGDLINEIQKSVEFGDVERLERNIQKALPLLEGLDRGIYASSYGVRDRKLDGLANAEKKKAKDAENNVYAALRNKFLSVEDSTDRGNIGYLKDAVLDAVTRPTRELEQWDNDDGATWRADLDSQLRNEFNQQNFQRLIKNEEVISAEEIETRIANAVSFQETLYKAKLEKYRGQIDRLVALEFHVKARVTFDSAFRQRQYVAFDKNMQSNMKKSVGLLAAEPDGTHWHAFYQIDREWGNAVDKVEREFVKMGFEGMYEGNLTTKDFKNWINRALSVSAVGEEDKRQRMDVVWAAWKQFCFKEMAGKFGMQIKDGRINFGANPPYMGDLSTWLSHPDLHRAAEFGWNKATLDEKIKNKRWNGKLVGKRTKPYKAITHSGHPIGIGELTTSDSPTNNDSRPIAKFGGKWKLGNYMEFATLQGGKYGGKNLWQIWWEGGISQASEAFPWVDTDIEGLKDQYSEAPSGSVGYWFLQRGRGMQILSDVLGTSEKKIPSISASTDLRNYEKLNMIRPGEVDRFGFPANPMYWITLGEVLFFISTRKVSGELDVATSAKGETMNAQNASHDEKMKSAIDHIYNRYKVGAISESERDMAAELVRP